MTTPLDDFVCFAMYTASHATTQAYREVLRPWKLTYPQYLALVVLATGERTVSSLGDDLGLDSGTLSPMLRRLETRGLVQRQRDDADERVVRVSLTDAGRATHADVMDAVGCLVPAFQQGGDLGALVRQLAAITESMRTLAGELRTAG
ncbi:MAG: transcriptional regulator [Microbacterium sp. SCN 70-200]|uniref:MarR family winged helix-turn-helix transcriptional regulator n=1 Tax=unclassified Microbacterium TaxID=2609290 RepID=UPI000869765C|nr:MULTISPECIES: MarR family transcriptional regulator [unclassified Microbacterium]MBN9214972.1 MarR family transcriptional regulator [Microbacterium sp.]ODT42937.1 MAG: transcriptional regulator [Microbacterium sp. SCN 70-200]OJV84756.1 MAG: transcriptional regulator [Microbacterium sp. 70-16]